MEPKIPAWIEILNDEDLHFLRRFLLCSGSLKALAAEYGVSYPTVRARLDRLIAKVQAADQSGGGDSFDRTVRILVADGALSATVARKLLDAHGQCTEEGRQRNA